MTTNGGKTIIVTGAGSGLGRAMTLALAECGANVVGIDVNVDGMNATGDMVKGLSLIHI